MLSIKDQSEIILNKIDLRLIIAYVNSTKQPPFNQTPPEELSSEENIKSTIKEMLDFVQKNNVSYHERFNIVIEKVKGSIEVKFIPLKCNALSGMFNK